jgi:hypothetical protein
MEKKISDYLHLYLGCDLYTGTGKVKLVAVQKEAIPCCEFRIIVLNGNVTHEAKNVKLLLRRLSSMSEKELQECGNMVYDFSDDPELNNHKPQDFEICAPEQFHYLLSKGFDLFGLIDSGLAIDKETIQS